MKKSRFSLGMLIMSFAIIMLFVSSCSKKDDVQDIPQTRLKASVAEVTLSGSTWTGKVDGVTKYTGTDLFAACNACIAAMSDGTINLRASGNSGASGGAIKAINLKSNITFNGNGYTITANTTDHLIVPIQADRKTNIKITNLRIAGAPRYAVWLKGCSGITISGLTMAMSSGWLGLRIDNSTAATSSANIGNVTVSGGSMGVETYGLDGFTAGTVTATDMTECGLLFNQSKNCVVTNVYATRCNYGGGYAGFRVANSNGPNVRVTGLVRSISCGRGFFSVTSSNGTYVNRLEASGCSSHGALLENCTYTTINGGYISNCGGDAGVRFSQNSHHNLINGLNINGVAKGISETSPGNYNTIQYCNANGKGITKSGANTVIRNCTY